MKPEDRKTSPIPTEITTSTHSRPTSPLHPTTKRAKTSDKNPFDYNDISYTELEIRKAIDDLKGLSEDSIKDLFILPSEEDIQKFNKNASKPQENPEKDVLHITPSDKLNGYISLINKILNKIEQKQMSDDNVSFRQHTLNQDDNFLTEGLEEWEKEFLNKFDDIVSASLCSIIEYSFNKKDNIESSRDINSGIIARSTKDDEGKGIEYPFHYDRLSDVAVLFTFRDEDTTAYVPSNKKSKLPSKNALSFEDVGKQNIEHFEKGKFAIFLQQDAGQNVGDNFDNASLIHSTPMPTEHTRPIRFIYAADFSVQEKE